MDFSGSGWRAGSGARTAGLGGTPPWRSSWTTAASARRVRSTIRRRALRAASRYALTVPASAPMVLPLGHGAEAIAAYRAAAARITQQREAEPQ